MKNHLLLISMLLLALAVNAQSRKEKKLLSKARVEADSGRYEEALLQLAKIETQDTTNANVEYLKAKCNYYLQQYDSAKLHLARYYRLQVDSTSTEYQELSPIALQLKIKAGEVFKNGRDTTGLIGGGFDEKATWELAFRTNDIKAYRNYVRFFPNGIHIEEAKQFVDYYEKRENNPGKLLPDAVRGNDWKLIKELLGKGADINYVEVHRNVIKKVEGTVSEYSFDTPLSLACFKFDYNMVKYFLEQGADPNRFVYRKINDYDKTTVRTRTILENMIISTSKTGIYSGKDARLIDFIDLMLHYGLDLNFYKGSPIATAVYFHDAKKFKRTLLIRYLLRKGADPYLHGDGPQDDSAVQTARTKGDKTMLKILRDKRYKDTRKKYQEKLEKLQAGNNKTSNK